MFQARYSFPGCCCSFSSQPIILPSGCPQRSHPGNSGPCALREEYLIFHFSFCVPPLLLCPLFLHLTAGMLLRPYRRTNNNYETKNERPTMLRIRHLCLRPTACGYGTVTGEGFESCGECDFSRDFGGKKRLGFARPVHCFSLPFGFDLDAAMSFGLRDSS